MSRPRITHLAIDFTLECICCTVSIRVLRRNIVQYIALSPYNSARIYLALYLITTMYTIN